MPNLNLINRAPPATLAVPLSKAPNLIGVSRSEIYRQAAKGNLKLIKAGRSTLLCMESARAFLAALPSAQVGGTKPATAA